jgi:hypothetical protein
MAKTKTKSDDGYIKYGRVKGTYETEGYTYGSPEREKENDTLKYTIEREVLAGEFCIKIYDLPSEVVACSGCKRPMTVLREVYIFLNTLRQSLGDAKYRTAEGYFYCHGKDGGDHGCFCEKCAKGKDLCPCGCGG